MHQRKKSVNKRQGIDPFYGKINRASVSQHALANNFGARTNDILDHIGIWLFHSDQEALAGLKILEKTP